MLNAFCVASQLEYLLTQRSSRLYRLTTRMVLAVGVRMRIPNERGTENLGQDQGWFGHIAGATHERINSNHHRTRIKAIMVLYRLRNVIKECLNRLRNVMY